MIDPADPLILELRRVVQRLALMSHAPIQGYNFAPPAEGNKDRWRTRVVCAPCRRRGLDSCEHRAPVAHLGQHSAKGGDTMIPRGALPRHDDREDGFRQKSHIYFQRKLDRLLRYAGSTEADLKALLAEAIQALEDWLKTPPCDGEEPLTRGTFRWKCTIADEDRDVETVKKFYMVSRATVYRYRATYRGLRRNTSARAV